MKKRKLIIISVLLFLALTVGGAIARYRYETYVPDVKAKVLLDKDNGPIYIRFKGTKYEDLEDYDFGRSTLKYYTLVGRAVGKISTYSYSSTLYAVKNHPELLGAIDSNAEMGQPDYYIKVGK